MDPLELKPISGQDYLVTDDALGAVRIPVYQGRINYRKDVEPFERRFYYAPYLTFIKDGDGISISIDDEDVEGKVQIDLRITYFYRCVDTSKCF